MSAIAIICFLLAYHLGWNSMHYAEISRAALKWPVVEGHVEFVRGRRSSHEVYVYSVSGRQYRSDLFGLPNLNPFHGFDRHKNGQRILVYFDPADPQRSAVNRTLDENQYRINLTYAVIALLFGAGAAVGALNDLMSHKQRLGFR